MNQNLYQLSYVSTGKDSLRFEEIEQILSQSVENNKKLNISGILIYCNKHFFQILEGDKQVVLELFNTIITDCRHDNVIKLQEMKIDERQFESWSMAFKSYNKELKALDNFNNEQFYSYINTKIKENNNVSMRILQDFFDLNG